MNNLFKNKESFFGVVNIVNDLPSLTKNLSKSARAAEDAVKAAQNAKKAALNAQKAASNISDSVAQAKAIFAKSVAIKKAEQATKALADLQLAQKNLADFKNTKISDIKNAEKDIINVPEDVKPGLLNQATDLIKNNPGYTLLGISAIGLVAYSYLNKSTPSDVVRGLGVDTTSEEIDQAVEEIPTYDEEDLDFSNDFEPSPPQSLETTLYLNYLLITGYIDGFLSGLTGVTLNYSTYILIILGITILFLIIKKFKS